MQSDDESEQQLCVEDDEAEKPFDPVDYTMDPLELMTIQCAWLESELDNPVGQRDPIKDLIGLSQISHSLAGLIMRFSARVYHQR